MNVHCVLQHLAPHIGGDAGSIVAAFAGGVRWQNAVLDVEQNQCGSQRVEQRKPVGGNLGQPHERSQVANQAIRVRCLLKTTKRFEILHSSRHANKITQKQTKHKHVDMTRQHKNTTVVLKSQIKNNTM